MEDRFVDYDLGDGFDVTLHRIEFDQDYEGTEEAPHRTFFEFRLHIEEGFQPFHLTMTAPHEGLADLERKAWIEAFALLRSFAEVIRRKTDLPEIKFPPAS